MMFLSSLTVYHFYRLFPLRRRDLQLLIGVVAAILLDFLIVEPLHLLCGAYASSVTFAHGLYLTLSTMTYHGLVYCVLLRIWTLYFDTKWLDLCCISSDQWRHHIFDPLSPPKDPRITATNRKSTDSVTIRNGSESQSNASNGSESKPNTKSNVTDREEKELEEEEIHSLTPSDGIAGASTPSTNAVSPQTADSNVSWFVRHRSTYGSVLFAAKCCALSAIISIVVHLVVLSSVDGPDRAVALYIVDVLPIALIGALWFAMPHISDYGEWSGSLWWRWYLIIAVITGIIQIAIKSVVTAMESEESALSILSVTIRLFTDFAATLCLLWYPRYSRHREILRIQEHTANGERAHSMSFQIEMTGKETTNDPEQMAMYQEQLAMDRQSLMTLFADKEQMNLFLKHCAREFSMENMFAILELLQFRVYCTEQQRFIEEERLHRKKTAKERYQRKKLSIHKKKRKRTKKLSKINVEDGDLGQMSIVNQ